MSCSRVGSETCETDKTVPFVRIDVVDDSSQRGPVWLRAVIGALTSLRCRGSRCLPTPWIIALDTEAMKSRWF